MDRVLTAVLSIVVVASVACGDANSSVGGPSSGSGTTSPPPSSTEPPPECDDLSDEARPTITIVNYKFAPKCFTTASGAKVTVENSDPSTHTFTVIDTPIDATILTDGAFHKGTEGLAAGDYDFYCRLHPSMKGTFTVV